MDSEVNGRYTGDDLGYVECSVSDIVTSRPFFRKQLAGVSKKVTREPAQQICQREVSGGPQYLKSAAQSATKSAARRCPKQSFLVVTAEQIANVGGSVTLQFAGRKLANKDGWFGKSDPFFLIHKGREDGSWVTVAKSEARGDCRLQSRAVLCRGGAHRPLRPAAAQVIMNNLNPSWKPYRIPFSLLCNGDFNRPLRIEVFDFDRDDSVDKIGHGDTTLAAMMRPGWELKLLHPKGKNKDVGTVVGTAIVRPFYRALTLASWRPAQQRTCLDSLETLASLSPWHPGAQPSNARVSTHWSSLLLLCAVCAGADAGRLPSGRP